MEKYVFESHLGGIYLLDEYEEPETCEQCGDCDQYIGMATVIITLKKRQVTVWSLSKLERWSLNEI